jgi:hypothetical protein
MKKKCANCGDTSQTNVRTLFRRNSDGTIFNICLRCAEEGLKYDSVQNFKTQKMTVCESPKALVESALAKAARRHPNIRNLKNIR